MANKHLYAADVLQEAALQMTQLMEHLTDEQVAGAQLVRQHVIDMAQSELMVTSGLVDVAGQEQSKC